MSLILKILFDFDLEMLFYLEMSLFTGLILIINAFLFCITVINEPIKNSIGLFICTLGLSTMNIIIPLLWKGRSNPIVQEFAIIFPVYNNVIWVIVLSCFGVYGVIKHKFEPLLGILCAVLILAGQLEIGLLGGILAAIQILIWNIVVSKMKPASYEAGRVDISNGEEKQDVQ